MAKVKIAYVKDKSKVIEVWAIDAREIVESGEYEYVIAPAVTVNVQADIQVTSTMKTVELNEFVESEGLVIEGFGKMNIKEKREAVAFALTLPKAVKLEPVAEPEVDFETEVDDI